ncbi:MAG: aldo/keto reductase [Chlorobi bacterium]|nr:aldo/keto reductase [Chlorobiota bacterium]
MEYRKFGKTELTVSATGFGAWAIGGPAFAGDIPIGWGKTDDRISIRAIHEALDQGITFFDTADFYGLGHSEILLGKTLGNREDVVVASKVGHRLSTDQTIYTDYSPGHIQKACEESLRRLKREAIDFYQLHTAKVSDLKKQKCIAALENLKKAGKIRYWGVSLNTYHPGPEAEYMIRYQLGSGFQLVFNILNQRAMPLLKKAAGAGYGIIARMPLQFGLLTGKINLKSHFEKSDHRSFRLTPDILKKIIPELSVVRDMAAAYGISQAALSLSFVLSFREINTVIPGIRTPEQARENAGHIVKLSHTDKARLIDKYNKVYTGILEETEKTGTGK